MDAWRSPGSAYYASETQLHKQKKSETAEEIANEPANYTTKPPQIPRTHRAIYKTPVPMYCVEADTMFLQIYKQGMYKYAYVFVCQFTGACDEPDIERAIVLFQDTLMSTAPRGTLQRPLPTLYRHWSRTSSQ